MEIKETTIVIYKVTWRDKLYRDFFNKVTRYVASDDVNKVSARFANQYNLKIRPYKTLDIII
jgi:hypothetical protein